MAVKKIYQASGGFVLFPGRRKGATVQRVVSGGQFVTSDDPDIRQMLKGGLVVEVVESATANPGEVRAVSPPKKQGKK